MDEGRTNPITATKLDVPSVLGMPRQAGQIAGLFLGYPGVKVMRQISKRQIGVSSIKTRLELLWSDMELLEASAVVEM